VGLGNGVIATWGTCSGVDVAMGEYYYYLLYGDYLWCDFVN